MYKKTSTRVVFNGIIIPYKKLPNRTRYWSIYAQYKTSQKTKFALNEYVLVVTTFLTTYKQAIQTAAEIPEIESTCVLGIERAT